MGPKKYDDKYLNDVLNLSTSEIEQVHEVSDAIAKRYEAEAHKESELKWRILFERTAAEMLPFVIYCLTFGPVAAYSYYQISTLIDERFYWALGGLILIMIIPAFILPRLPFQSWFSKKKEEPETV